MRCLVLVMLLLTTAASAAERILTGDEIAALLPDIIAVGETTRQTFDADGRTDYDDGRRPTVGRWRVENDSYCSQWPPGGGWRCYEVLIDDTSGSAANLIIWVDTELGDRTINTILPKGQ